MDDGVIDIKRFQSRPPDESGGTFSLWGGDGDRARLALPIWRSVFLVGGDWGGITYLKEGMAQAPVPFFILDLAQDPARTTPPEPPVAVVQATESPALARPPGGGVAVFLGEEEGKRWFLQVRGDGGAGLVEGKKREDLLFLAGECAGLLFFREFAAEAE